MIIRKATTLDVESFSPHSDDLAEALSAGVDWKANLLDAIGEHTVALEFNGKVLAIGGNTGDQCWFVTDASITELPKVSRLAFRRAILEYRNAMLSTYEVLWNFVWVGNKNHIRFLESIGAVFHEEYTESPITGDRFQLFTIN